MKNERVLIILRGLPGSGKSRLAVLLSEKGRYPVFSIDDFFTDPQTGNYCFEFEKNHLAYALCETNTKAAMANGIAKIFLHNTFTMKWEPEPYFRLASEFNYEIHIVTVENYHGNKNLHGINDEQVRKMAEKYSVKLF